MAKDVENEKESKILQPVRTKYESFKGRIHDTTRAVRLNYGQFGLKAIQPDRIIGKQIEAACVALTRYRKNWKVWTKFSLIFNFKKTYRSRMGKVKDLRNIMHVGKLGRIMFEIDGVAKRCRSIQSICKTSIKTKFIKR